VKLCFSSSASASGIGSDGIRHPNPAFSSAPIPIPAAVPLPSGDKAVAESYQELRSSAKRVGIDLKIVDDRYQDVYPSNRQGRDFFKLVHQATANFR
jgi:hypothetical protein